MSRRRWPRVEREREWRRPAHRPFFVCRFNGVKARRLQRRTSEVSKEKQTPNPALRSPLRRAKKSAQLRKHSRAGSPTLNVEDTCVEILETGRGRSQRQRLQRSLSTFPSQHHSVPYGQADILNAGVGLNETVKGDNRVSISIPGLYHFATPQNIVANDQPARFK